MRNVVKNELNKLWSLFVDWIKIFMFGYNEESDIPEYREEIVNQYSIVKWNMDKMFNNTDGTVFDIRTIVHLYQMAEKTRTQALEACMTSMTQYEKRYMNGILSDMSEVVNELEIILRKLGCKNVGCTEVDRSLSYIMNKVKMGDKYKLVNL